MSRANPVRVKLYNGENIPLELHKVCIVQKLNPVSIERRAGLFPHSANAISGSIFGCGIFPYENQLLIGGLAPVSDWPEKLIARFKANFGDSL
jgi:hypothetical protein